MLIVVHELIDQLESVVQHVAAGERNVLVCPIPLSHERLVERGFNQAELISARVYRRLCDAAAAPLGRARRGVRPGGVGEGPGGRRREGLGERQIEGQGEEQRQVQEVQG